MRIYSFGAVICILFCLLFVTETKATLTDTRTTISNTTICVYSNRVETFPSSTTLLKYGQSVYFYIYLFVDSCDTNPVNDANITGWISTPNGTINYITYSFVSNGLYNSSLYTFDQYGTYNLTVSIRSPTIGNITSTSTVIIREDAVVGVGSSGYFGVPIQLGISNITIHNATSNSLSISFKIANTGYTNPTKVNVTQRLLRKVSLISPTEIEVYSNSSIISLNTIQNVNSTLSWLGVLPDGIYKIEILGVSVADPRAMSMATILFNYTYGNYTVENETVYSVTLSPTIVDVLNNPNSKPVLMVVGIGTGGVFTIGLIYEWRFKKRKPTPKHYA